MAQHQLTQHQSQYYAWLLTRRAAGDTVESLVARRVAQLQQEARELATAGEAAERRLGEATEALTLRTTER